MSLLFEDSYIEITLPLTRESISKIDDTEYSYILNDLRSECSHNPRKSDVWCEIKVGFDLKNGGAYFALNTITAYDDEPYDMSVLPRIDFDPETAEYFKKEAVGAVLESLSAMYR